jgi:hypothetical protein
MDRIMKKLLYIVLTAVAIDAASQDFDKNLASARTSYSSGDLENARFAMEQLLRDLDVAIGKEILKMLPTSVANLTVNEKEDNLSGGSGFGGLFVHRGYGADPKTASVEIINNSPLINSLNAILSMPMGGMMRDENQKQIKVQGYKSMLNRQVDSDTGKTNYELQIPMNNTLVTVKIADTNEAEITQAANALPLSKIATLAQ